MAGPPEIIRAAATAKQAADLHTSTVCQAVILQLLEDGFPLPAHIQRVCAHYGERAQAMIHALRHAAPQGTRFTEPEGGMFLWLSLPPQGPTSMELFHAAMEQGVAFVPGTPFFLDGGGAHAARLNFTAASSERIEQGILRLCQCLTSLLQAKADSKRPEVS
jgi:2-aminoadipate transaminase